MAQASFEVISAARRLQDAGFARTASRKHDQLDAAISLGDLARPGNRLEALRGRRTNGGSASSGLREIPARPKWKSWTTINSRR